MGKKAERRAQGEENFRLAQKREREYFEFKKFCSGWARSFLEVDQPRGRFNFEDAFTLTQIFHQFLEVIVGLAGVIAGAEAIRIRGNNMSTTEENNATLPEPIRVGLQAKQFYNEIAQVLGPQPRFTDEEKDAIVLAILKGIKWGQEDMAPIAAAPEPIGSLIERSSLGTPAAAALRAQALQSDVDKILARADELGGEPNWLNTAKGWLSMRRLSAKHAPELAAQFKHIYGIGKSDERGKHSRVELQGNKRKGH